MRKEAFITIMRKNIIKIAAITLLSAFALTACDDEIIAKPTGYDKDSPVVDVDGGKTVYNNDFQSIYDSIRSGNLASDVLDELLYQYSVSVFGSYNKITAKGDEITLKQAVKSISGDKADANAFIKAHSAFWTKDKAGNRLNDNLEKVDNDTAVASDSEIARLQAKWDTIEKRIAKQLYSQVSGGAYSERNIFEEERFLQSLGADIENKVANPNDAGVETFKGVITPAVEDYEVFTEATEDVDGNPSVILHRANYQFHGELTENEDDANNKITYVEDKIIPGIYRQLLVEQYILDESYDTLGRTSARNVSVLSIKKNSNYAKGAVDLMNTFVNDYIFDNARSTDITLDTFKMVSNAWIGAFMDDANYATSDEYALINAAVPEYLQTYNGSDVNGNPKTYNYFQGTAYGDMIEEIKKINDNPDLSQNESSYTGNNAYTKEIGMQIKTNGLKLNDYTSTGWYVKSVGISSLPDSIKNQIFDINVANALNGEACVKYEYDGTKWTTNETEDNLGSLINVVGEIKGQYFLRNTTRVKDNPVQSDILFESDGTYYIVLIEDAIRSKNLNKDNYDKDTYATLERYINEIVEIVADSDTYKNLSKQHWVEKMDLKYHDQVIYDYFKTNFPDLFEDAE